MFKHIFGNNDRKDLTISLLSAVDGKHINSFQDVNIMNSITLNGNTIKKKEYETDVIVETRNCLYSLEMQNNNTIYSTLKNIIYSFKLFSGQLDESEGYDLIKPVRQIIIVNGDYTHKNNRKLVDKYVLTSKDGKSKLLEKYYIVEVVDINCEIDYTKTSKELISWINLFKVSGEENLKNISNKNPILERTVREMLSYYKDGYVQSTKEAERLQQTYINVSHKRGIKLGEQRGEQKANMEVAKRLAERNMNPQEIEEITGISYDKITEFM